MNTKKQYVQALTSHRTFIKGNYYPVVQDIFCGNMWNFPEVNSGDCWLAPKQYFSEVVSEVPKQKQYVQALSVGSLDKHLTVGEYYELFGEQNSNHIYTLRNDSGYVDNYFKTKFGAPVNEIPTVPKQKLENVFIRVNGDAEKEAAVELLKSMGYSGNYDNFINKHFTVCMVTGDIDGTLGNVSNTLWNYDSRKELKVDKQTFIQPKTVFTLAKEKTFHIDGKELTRVEVEGMIQGMDIKMNCLRNMIGE